MSLVIKLNIFVIHISSFVFRRCIATLWRLKTWSRFTRTPNSSLLFHLRLLRPSHQRNRQFNNNSNNRQLLKLCNNRRRKLWRQRLLGQNQARHSRALSLHPINLKATREKANEGDKGERCKKIHYYVLGTDKPKPIILKIFTPADYVATNIPFSLNNYENNIDAPFITLVSLCYYYYYDDHSLIQY